MIDLFSATMLIVVFTFTRNPLDERLRRPTRLVRIVDDSVRKLAANMLATMYENNGCGLAAPQVGSDLRVFVMDTQWRDDGITMPDRLSHVARIHVLMCYRGMARN